MKYTVTWTRSAVNVLADIWTNATDRNAITIASNGIDHELTQSPETKGVEFYGDRLLVIGPLHAVFKVDPPDRKVTVLDVWAV